MFLDFTQEGAYNFKNHIDNFILIKKISEFNLLLVDFSLGILDKYNKKISTRSVISGNMNMSMDEGQGFGAIKSDKKDDMDNAKKEEKKKITELDKELNEEIKSSDKLDEENKKLKNNGNKERKPRKKKTKKKK